MPTSTATVVRAENRSHNACGAGNDVPATDTIRLGVIGRDRTLPFRELFARIEADSVRVAKRLGELDDAQAAQRGIHPARGEMTIREMTEPFLVGHTEGHVTQLREILATPR